MDEDQELEPEPPTPRRSCALLLVALVLCVGGCLALGAALHAYRYEISRSLATFDTRLVLTVSGEEFAPEGVADELRARLRRHGVLAQVTVERGGIVVLIEAADRAWVDPIVSGAAEFRVLVEVPPATLSPEAYRAQVERIQAAQAAEKWSPLEDDYATYPWHAQAYGARSEPLLLETKGMLDASHFASFSVAMDANGLPVLGFETTRRGARRLRALSEEAQGRRLALVINGEIRSAPVVRGVISKSGIVEGGKQGWTHAEVEALAIQLEASQVPYRLELVEEAAIPPQAGGR